MKIFLFPIFFFFCQNFCAQNLFGESFENCFSDKFFMESDSIVTFPRNDLLDILDDNIEKEIKSNLNGLVSLQILVDENGNSCLLSIDNQTNYKTSKLKLKEIIDEKLFWKKPTSTTSVIIALRFYTNKVQQKRIGMNKNSGFHVINR